MIVSTAYFGFDPMSSPIMNEQISERAEEGDFKNYVVRSYSYPSMSKTQTRGESRFVLHVEEGTFTDSEIIVLLGENGT